MASTTEILLFDPEAGEAPRGRGSHRRPHPVLDGGELATLVLLLGVFAAPTVAWAIYGSAQARVGSGSELHALLWSALLALLLPVLQIFVHIRRFGGPQVRGNRECYPVADGAAGRIARGRTPTSSRASCRSPSRSLPPRPSAFRTAGRLRPQPFTSRLA